MIRRSIATIDELTNRSTASGKDLPRQDYKARQVRSQENSMTFWSPQLRI
jgi:hypothetical protein